MATLLAILMPHIVAAGANIGLGVTNAIQGDSSSVSLQIGRKVFTTKKSCNLDTLPPELRMQIILLALEGSKELISDVSPFLHPGDPLTRHDLQELEKQNPFNPRSENYRSIKGGEAQTNGYPLSSWRWLSVDREWRAVVEGPLWASLDVKGVKYSKLLRGLEGKAHLPPLDRVKRLVLLDGFNEPSDLYTIICSPLLVSLDTIEILPHWPTPFHPLEPPVAPFPFGLQLLRSVKPIKSLTYGLPLESTTNATSRQHLRTLSPRRLSLTFDVPTLALFTELQTLLSETLEHLSIRYVPSRYLVDAHLFLSEPLRRFRKIDLYLLLPRPRMILVGPGNDRSLVEDPESPRQRFISRLVEALEAADEDVRDMYTVWIAKHWEVPGRAHRAEQTRIWPVPPTTDVLFDGEVEGLGEGSQTKKEVEGKEKESSGWSRNGAVAASSSSTASRTAAGAGEKTHWERETNLRLLGGLVNLRLESKKH